MLPEGTLDPCPVCFFRSSSSWLVQELLVQELLVQELLMREGRELELELELHFTGDGWMAVQLISFVVQVWVLELELGADSCPADPLCAWHDRPCHWRNWGGM